MFEQVDDAAWRGLGQNPIALLSQLNESRARELAAQAEFVSLLEEAYQIQRRYLSETEETWFQKTYGILHRNYLVAYFSAEFGLASFLRTYSGGLGILAGDHLKSASDLGIPLVGVGLFYKRGYFSQLLSDDGWQAESYPENEPGMLPVEPVMASGSQEPLIVSVHIGDRQVRIRAWKASVGRVPLYLLDTNLPGLNSREDCEITAELYGGDARTRIQQEMVLGIGGAKLLAALKLRPTLFHMNEGHSAFVTLERIRESQALKKSGEESLPRQDNEDTPASKPEQDSFTRAKNAVRATCLFTTHTPVPAGIDVFPRDLFIEYLGSYAEKLGLRPMELFALGQETPYSEGFNMAVLAMRLSSDVNAVSKLHRDVARKMWESLLKESGEGGEPNGSPLASVTNGVHIQSWISDSMAALYDDYFGRNWVGAITDPDTWHRIFEVPDEVLWGTRSQERKKLIGFIADRLPDDKGVTKVSLDPHVLTIGFARRFATYKRANLILRDVERLDRLLSDASRPIQFVFAGKAHPKDYEGKKLIKEIFDFTKNSSSSGRVVFLPDYDISIAHAMVQGVDLWLNNPRRPLEACGTSGMKVVANGGLNLSVLDGWWDEAFTASAGWAIGTGREYGYNVAEQDRVDSTSLYEVLENEVIPDFYDRNSPQSVPARWVQKIKSSIATLSPVFNTHRMVMEYSQRFYFKDGGLFAHRLNRSELGAELLERVSTDWEDFAGER